MGSPSATCAADANVITVVSANLLAGGIGRSRFEQRFGAALELLQSLAPDVLALQECLYWDEDNYRLWNQARARLDMEGVLGISPHSRMHTAVLVRHPLELHDRDVTADGIWKHSVTRARIGFNALAMSGSFTLASAHLHPHSPARRLLEAEELAALAGLREPVILAADTNTLDPGTDLSALSPARRVRYNMPGTDQVDTRAIDRLVEAGFTDLADKPVPTTGHWPGKPLRGRPDRILASPAAAAAASSTETLADANEISDHRWLRIRLSLPNLAAAGA